jgi:hypothetical protein
MWLTHTGPHQRSAILDPKADFLRRLDLSTIPWQKGMRLLHQTTVFGRKLRAQGRLVPDGNGLTFAERHNMTGALAVVRCLLSYMYIVNE